MPDGLAPFFSVAGQQTGILACLAVVAGNTLLNSLALPRLGLHPWPEICPKVAVLIPACNEARDIRRCVESLLNQDYPDFGLWVLDDDSRDRTSAILAELAAHELRLRAHKSAPLPPGWSGKDWACWQLAQAVPEAFPLLLFVDADTFPEIDVLDVGRLLLNYVLSDPYVDAALVGMREPRYAEINSAISDDVASRLDLAQVHERYVR